MVALTSSVAALLLAAAGGNALPQTANGVTPVPANSPTVASSSWSGNGCPQGTVEFVAGDPTLPLDTGIAVLRRFFTAIGPDYSPMDKTRNCQAHINVRDIEPGWQFAVKNIKVSGYADVQEGVTLTVFATSYFSQNARDTVTQQFSQTGKLNSAVTIDIPFDNAGPWSPCGSTGILNINFRTSFTSTVTKAKGYFGARDGIPYVTEKIEYVWRKC